MLMIERAKLWNSEIMLSMDAFRYMGKKKVVLVYLEEIFSTYCTSYLIEDTKDIL